VVTQLRGAVAVVTGGASGIGRALAERFALEGARAVVVADLDEAGAKAVADTLDCDIHLGVGLDVTRPEQVGALVDRIEDEIGGIDLWCSNAGIGAGLDLGTDEDWERSWRIHVMAHVYAARALMPRMVERGRGHFLVTASAAGLLTEIDTAPYAVTKHGSVAIAEWLAINYGGDTGVEFSCLCPQAVRTPLLAGLGAASTTLAAGDPVEPAEVADAVVAALAEGRFLILPHPEVADYERRRAGDRDRWLAGMRRLRARARAAAASDRPSGGPAGGPA
jgi:NAD(P)-dependent dehydrogenase (short-subunit alcohol dehydrogenase family)